MEENRKNKIIQFFQQITRKEKAGILIVMVGILIISLSPLYLPSEASNKCDPDYRYWTYNGIYHRGWCPLRYDAPWEEQGDISNCNISQYTLCNRCNPPSYFIPEPKIDYVVNFSGLNGGIYGYGEMGSNWQRNVQSRLEVISDGILPNGLTFAHVHAIIEQNEAVNTSKYQMYKVIFSVNEITLRASIFTQDLGEYDWNVTLSPCSLITYAVDFTLIGGSKYSFERCYQCPIF